MIKVIELDIDAELSGDTGVFEVALVEYPAIEQELIYFSRQKFYKAPEYVSAKACQAIKENDKRGNPAGTQVGKVRAQQLCKRDEISLETIKRMKSFLERAATYNTGNWDDNGTIAYGLWGGEEALTWVDKILRQVESQEKFVDSANGISVGDYVSWTFAGRSEDDDRARGRVKDIRVQGEVNVPETDYTLSATDDNPVALIETASGKVVGQYVKNLRKIQKPENFVNPNPGEEKTEYISRCIGYLVRNEGYEQDQAAAICYSTWEQDFAFEKVSFDWDGTLSTARGKRLLEQELRRGNIPYIISARSRTDSEMLSLAREYNIPGNRVFALGNNTKKIEKVRDLGIVRHYDNNPSVIRDLAGVGMAFDYDTSALPAYDNYPKSGDTDSMLTKPVLPPVLFSEDCGCNKTEEFNVVGYIDGWPVYETKEEAEILAKELGCQGSHEHTDENGNVLYMPCEVHPDYDEEEYELFKAIEALKFERNNNAVVDIIRSGFFEYEIFGKTIFRNGQKFYRYERKPEYAGIGDTRTFCNSIENKYFRRSIIDQMDDLNFEFGHGQGGGDYSKWLYKGGPNCVHAWKEYFYRFNVDADGVRVNERLEPGSWASGLAGTAPRAMRNNGYFDKDTKKASERAYAISQNYSALGNNDGPFNVLYGDLSPLDYVDGLPIYGVEMQAQDASYAIGCGGAIEKIEYEGKEYYMACSRKAKKVEMQKQLFATQEEKRMIYTPLMIPNILIPRLDEVSGEKYYVKFLPETIAKIQRKFMIEQRLRETNLEHSDLKFKDIVMVESWIVQGDKDKAYELGFTKDQIPFGSWMAGYTVLETDEGNKIWNEYIKPGKVKGASVEGNFILNFSTYNNDEYLLKKIINILKQIS